MKSKYDPNQHNRRSIRLKGYDYSQAGLYFITFCVQHRVGLFGHIAGGAMALNDAGKMIEKEWLALCHRFPTIELHEYVVMPNHFHAIVQIVGATLVVAPEVAPNAQGNEENPPNEEGQPQGIAPTGLPNEENLSGEDKSKTLGDILGAFKSITTVEYIRGVKSEGWMPFNGKLWQRNYWEHIIRDERALENIAAYIENNPLHWNVDALYLE